MRLKLIEIELVLIRDFLEEVSEYLTETLLCYSSRLFFLLAFIVLLQNKHTQEPILHKTVKLHKRPASNKRPLSRSKNLISAQGG